MHKFESRLVLGSVNFGVKYGISNKMGIISQQSIKNIIEVASNGSIRFIDTAQDYGSSEKILGEHYIKNFSLISKVGRLNCEKEQIKLLLKHRVLDTIKRLNVTKLYAILLHSPEELLEDNGSEIVSALRFLQDQGLVEKVGVSIYSPEILKKIFKIFMPDLVQAPFNIFDQRINLSGMVEILKNHGSEIHLRSTFLQGLLLLKEDEVPKKFLTQWPAEFKGWFNAQSKTELNAVDLALSYSLSQKWADKIIVGVDHSRQLKQILDIEIASNKRNDELFYSAVSDEDLINPSNWEKI